MNAKLVVWMDGCWRSLEDIQAEGRRLRFAVLRNGLIKMLSLPPKASNIVAGEPLLYRNKKRRKKISKEKENIRNHKISGEKDNVRNRKENIININIAEKRNIRNNNTSDEKDNNRNDKENIKKNNILVEQENVRNEKDKIRNKILPDEKNYERKIKEVKKNGITTRNISNADNHKMSRDLERVNIPINADSSAESVSSSHSEELVIEIEDKDVLMMRKFFLKTQVYQVDVNRFDKDKAYRQATLYRFHPVVQVERLLPRLHHQLAPSQRSSRRTSLQKKTASTTAKSSGKPSKPVRRRPSIQFRKSSVPAGREYSSLEDHAIVAWLSAARERERAVNGNRVWRQLQAQHARLTGQERTWQSLRNRYLRYILPALGLLALPPGHAQRLRAAAATGEIKSRKRCSLSIRPAPAPVRTAHPRARLLPSPAAAPAPAPAPSPSDHSDEVKENKAVRKSKSAEKGFGFLLKRIQMEKPKNWSGNSDTDEEIPKKMAPNNRRDSEENDSEGETRERSRLRRRPLNFSDNSDVDNTYAPKSPLKKRRKLFNPLA